MRLTIRWPERAEHSFGCGERIRAEARLLPPAVYHDPGAWSRADFLLEQGVTSTATVDAARVERLGTAKGIHLACRVGGLQREASTRIVGLPAAMRFLPNWLRLSGDDGAMMTAMVTGDRTFLTHTLRVGFERTGSFHMLVVSGFHLAIVAGCFLWIARLMRLPRVPATLATTAASFGYALFTGFATPVQRSLWMVSLYLLGRLIYRERSALNTIGFSALCLLAVSPRSMFESSFQMTLLAVVSIGGVAAPLLERTIHPYLKATRDLELTVLDVKLPPRVAQFRLTLRMFAQRLRGLLGWRVGARLFPGTVRFVLRICELVVVSFVVEAAMTLPMAIYFHRITVFALPVNLLILPLLGVLMPVALVTLLVLVVWPAAAVIPGALAALLLHVGVGMVRLFGAIQWGDFRLPQPGSWQIAAFWILLAVSVGLAAFAGGGKWSRRGAVVALAGAAIAAVAPHAADRPRGALLVEAIDVGQGDSLLLITPDGKTMLVDGGGFGGGPRQAPQEFDVGDQVVSPALWARGIRRLDVVALSHAHSDHMGGLPAVLRNFHPAELWVGDNPRSTEYLTLLDEAASLGVRVRAMRGGNSIALGSAQVNVLAPTDGYHPGPEPKNNDSMVLRVAYGGTSVLLEGDAEHPVEHAMLADRELGSTLLKVGHHGSSSSTGEEFLSHVSPQWAIISCGRHNRYRHPRPETLNTLQQAHVRTFSTDINGAMCFLLDGSSVTAAPCVGP